MLVKLLATTAITALLSAGGTLYTRTGLIASLLLLGTTQMHAALPLRTATLVITSDGTVPPSASADLMAGAEVTAPKVLDRGLLGADTSSGQGVSVVPAIVTSDLNGSLTVQPISASAWSSAGLGDDPSLTLPVTQSLAGTAIDGLSAGQHVLLRIAKGAAASGQPTKIAR